MKTFKEVINEIKKDRFTVDTIFGFADVKRSKTAQEYADQLNSIFKQRLEKMGQNNIEWKFVPVSLSEPAVDVVIQDEPGKLGGKLTNIKLKLKRFFTK